MNTPENDDALQGLMADIDREMQNLKRTGESADYANPVRDLPRHGVFFRWPEESIGQWVHPDDIEVAERLMPGGRIFQLHVCPDPSDVEAGYRQLSYGQQTVRIRPAMWLRVPSEGYQLGDRVEVISKNGEQDPQIGDIVEVFYDAVQRQTQYRLSVSGMTLRKRFTSEDIRPCRRLGVPLDARERELLASQMLR